MFLQLLVNSEKPLVVTNSQRPHMSVGNDGDMNLLNSILVGLIPNPQVKAQFWWRVPKIMSCREVLKNYFVDTLPNEVLKNIARLNAISDSAWAMAARAKEKGSDKLEADALRLAKDTAKEIIDFVTNNKCLINSAFEAVDQDDEEKQEQVQQQEVQMNNLKESQEDNEREEPIV